MDFAAINFQSKMFTDPNKNEKKKTVQSCMKAM